MVFSIGSRTSQSSHEQPVLPLDRHVELLDCEAVRFALGQNAIQSIHVGGDRTGVGNESVKGNERANSRKKGEHPIERHACRKRQNPIF
jgi:hypothetical protein